MMVKLAYFFVPLPESLPLHDGYTLTITQDLDIDVIARLDATSQEEEAILRECLEISASLRFWHASVGNRQSGVLDQLFRVAQKAIPDLSKPKPDADQSVSTSDITVVEVVVPLDTEAEDSLSAAFNLGLNRVREFQRAYYVAERTPLTLVTRERLPSLIPYGVRCISASSDRWPQSLSLFHVNWNVSPLDRGPLLSGPQVERVREALEAQPGYRAFAAFVDMWRRAHVAFHREGDYQASAIYAAVAAEVLLDDLLAHLIWEEGIRPEAASAVFEGGLAARVKSQFHVRIGGSGWGAKSGSAIAAWDQDVASLRHRVVHAAYEPSIDEVRKAMAALKGLQDFLVSRLTSTAGLATYPRTAVLFVGREMLKDFGCWTTRLEKLQEDPQEAHWVSTFARWKSAMQRTLRGELSDDVEAEGSVLVAVLHPGRQIVWVLHARTAGMACLAEPPGSLSDGQKAALDKFKREHSDAEEPITIAMHGTSGTPMQGGQWTHEYRILPFAGVMVNGKDLDPIRE